jgi:phosphatidylglycerophosphatase A
VSIKESSDELNPTVVVPEGAVAPPTTRRSGLDYLALAISTCGVGYLPLAPGTFGTVVGVAIFLLLRNLLIRFYPGQAASGPRVGLNPQFCFLALELLIILVITLLGIWAASRTERVLRLKDPGKVVVDEVAGQMIALLPIPLFAGPWKIWVIVSFILFRFFDILKPYPAWKLEDLHGGLGIMADDVVAGAYAAVGTAVFMAVFTMSVI